MRARRTCCQQQFGSDWYHRKDRFRSIQTAKLKNKAISSFRASGAKRVPVASELYFSLWTFGFTPCKGMVASRPIVYTGWCGDRLEQQQRLPIVLGALQSGQMGAQVLHVPLAAVQLVLQSASREFVVGFQRGQLLLEQSRETCRAGVCVCVHAGVGLLCRRWRAFRFAG